MAQLIRNGLFTLALLLCLPQAQAGTAPDFTLTTAGGESVSLADYRGQPVVLHFWASWCPACKHVQPGLQALADEYSERGLVLLGVNFAEDEGVEPQAVLAERGLTFQTLLQGEAVVESYGVKGTPTTYFIDREGEIQGMTNTYKPDDPELRELAAKIL